LLSARAAASLLDELRAQGLPAALIGEVVAVESVSLSTWHPALSE